ncbi:MAG: xanthine dehydrogenase family protein molybdopterin-binding subunit [Vicinamibacterales bacterium]
MADTRLVGQNYITPDMVAKVTGRAKFAEDFRAEGMLFARQLLSPMPHARVTRIDTSEALKMPGVKAILTADDLPKPQGGVTDLGQKIAVDPHNERALTMEPLYQGEPILAVAAVDELTAIEAIEKIVVEYEPLPFVTDPLESLRPGGPNARTDGNVWIRKPGDKSAGPFAPLAMSELKWTQQDFDTAADGQLPMGKPGDEWTYGDLEAGFKAAAVVVDESFLTPNVSHQTLEPRTSMAYWQNGKLYLHCGTQSTVQTIIAVAALAGVTPDDVVVISEYTGGGFGSKITSDVSSAIPALLSKKAGAPVMMRISREEEHYMGGARPAFHGRVRAGFDKEGRITALDLFVISDNGPYEAQGDGGIGGLIASLLYQPLAMRYRTLTVLTNTPPRISQSQPGGMQAITVVERAVEKAARELGIDQVTIRRVNAPKGQAVAGPPGPGAPKGGMRTTSAFMQEALDRGRELFKWDERKAQSGKRNGSKVRGVGVAVSTFFAGSAGFDGLLVIKPDGKLHIQSGIGNFGSMSVSDVHRVAADVLGLPWDDVELTWGNTGQHLPWTCISGGSQTTHAMTRAAHAAASDAKTKLQELAAKVLGGRPESYTVAGGKVTAGGRSLTFAQAAQKAIELGGKFDGHEVPEDINAHTKKAAAGLAGQGLMGVARDKYPVTGASFSFVAGFAEVEVDVETGKYALLDYLGVADVGTVLHPRSLGGQILGRSMLGIAHAIGQKWVYDQHYGVSLARRFYQNRPPTVLDAPEHMQWAALDIPDPGTPVGSRGIGEPPVAAGCNAVLNALIDAVGENVIRRAPVEVDQILTSLEAGRPAYETLTANI